MNQETKQIFSIRKFKTGTHSALLAKYGVALATTAVLMGAATVSANEVTAPQTQPATEQVAPATESSQEQSAITSDIATSVPGNTTQAEAVKAVEGAQETLKDDVEIAKDAGVVVTEGNPQEVVINDNNATEKTNEVLTDLNKQDQAVKAATEKQRDNVKAYEETKAEHEKVVKEGKDSLDQSTANVDALIVEAKKAGLLVTETTTDKTPEYQSTKGLTGDALRQAMAENLKLYQEAIAAGLVIQGKSVDDLKQAMALYKTNQEAYKATNSDRQKAFTEGQKNLTASTTDVDALIAEAKKAGLLVTETTTDLTPGYKASKGLTGDALRKAMDENLKLYQEAIQSGISLQGKSVAELKQAMALYEANQQAYTDASTLFKNGKTQGVAELELADGRQKEVVDLAQKNAVPINVTSEMVSPKYVTIKGLTGDALREAIKVNMALYQQAVVDSVAKQDQFTNSAKTKLSAYLKELADYKAGIGTESGLKWASNTTVEAGTAQKMTGNEPAVSWGNLKTAAADAIQSLDRNQNTDAKFDNLFKINGSGTVVIKNTSNGDVTLKISNIQAWQANDTYLAVWGAKDGGIAWGVFAISNNGTVTGGAGEGATGGNVGASGAILSMVKSYDYEVSTSNAVSTVTFNDIDNNQTVTLNGLDGSTLVKGRNVRQTGTGYSTGAGDVSQASGGVIDSNGIQFNFEEAKKVIFSGSHFLPGYINTSIVAGIFGVASEVAKEPKKLSLDVKNLDVIVPEAPEAPKPLSVSVKKATVGIFSEADKPTPPSVTAEKVTVAIPNAPEAPAPVEVEVHYYEMKTTPAPEVPAPNTPVKEASVSLPSTGEAGSVLGMLSGIVLTGLSAIGARKRRK